MDQRMVVSLLEQQCGVISRRQVVAAGGDDNLIERKIRRREWVALFKGVYLNHTGAPTWDQRAWAAVLFYWPAALCHESALVMTGPDRPADPTQLVHVAIAHPRSAVKLDGVRLHRLTNLPARVRWNLSPPRLVVEEAVLDVCADRRSNGDALAVAAEACQRRRTTPTRLLAALDGRQRLRHGRWLRSAFHDIAAGATSVLEHAYLRKVERGHRLPSARRQLSYRTVAGRVYRDVEYDAFGLVVELDGRIGHELIRDRWIDQGRDLDAAGEEDKLTVRIGWVHAEDQPCLTALRVGRVLQRRGWSGSPAPCGPGCLVGATQPVGFPAPQAGDPTDNDSAGQVSR